MKQTYRLYWKHGTHTVIETIDNIVTESHREWLIGKSIAELSKKYKIDEWV